jgi:hypothetical protein
MRELYPAQVRLLMNTNFITRNRVNISQVRRTRANEKVFLRKGLYFSRIFTLNK